MKKLLLSLCLLSHCAVAQPVDNPLAAFYDGTEGYPAWTDGIAWQRVVNMKTYAKGANDFEKFENARDEMAAQGGGVLYYPAGTYDFSTMPADGPNGRGLMLKSGVVIRGEAPQEKDIATDGKLNLPTKFVFGFAKKAGGEVPRDWNIIGLMPRPGEQLKDVSNVGITWVHLVGATIYFGAQAKWGETWGSAEGWKSKFVKDSWKARVPDGTHPMDTVIGATLKPELKEYQGAGKGRLVFGCVLEDSAVLNDAFEEGNGANAFYTFKFGPRIGVFGSRVFVGNNLLPKSRRNFLYRQTTRKTSVGKGGNSMILGEFVPDTPILFDYGKTCGIDVNKDLISLLGKDGQDSAGLYEEGIIVRDNWVYNHGHKGFNLSGSWLTIKNNHNERDYLKGGDDVYGVGSDWILTLDGNLRANAGGNGTISDNLSRAFDLGGKNLWIDGNFFNNVGSDPGNDGEGILCQKHGGTDLYSWAVTRNKHERGSGEKSYIGGWDVKVLGCLIAWNQTSGWVGQTKVSPTESSDEAYVANQAEKVNVPKNSVALIECPPHAPAAPRDVKAEIHAGDAIKISWSDASDNEIGFRVERSFDGKTWTAIAYRPPHIQGSPENPQAWIDFLAPRGKGLFYRVLSINCDDNEAGASVAVQAALPKQ